MGKDEGGERSSPGGAGQREMELGDTEGSEQVTELNEGEVGRSERTQGKAREPQGSHWEAAPAWAGGLAKAAETGPTADISALPTKGLKQPGQELTSATPPASPSHLAQVRPHSGQLQQVWGPWGAGKASDGASSPVWGIQRWHWAVAR